MRRQSTTEEILIARGFRRESTTEDILRCRNFRRQSVQYEPIVPRRGRRDSCTQITDGTVSSMVIESDKAICDAFVQTGTFWNEDMNVSLGGFLKSDNWFCLFVLLAQFSGENGQGVEGRVCAKKGNLHAIFKKIFRHTMKIDDALFFSKLILLSFSNFFDVHYKRLIFSILFRKPFLRIRFDRSFFFARY